MVDALRIRRVNQSLWLWERMVRNVTVVHLYNMRSLFFWRGGGAERSSSLLSFFSLIAFPAPIPFFLTFLPLSLFLYLNITHCCVFPPISPVSHPSRIPTPPSLSSSAPYSSRHRSSRAPRPCPPPLFSFLNFFFQTCCGEQAFHLGEVVIIKFFLLMAVTAYLQQFSLFKHAFVFQILWSHQKIFQYVF